jgi:hypothetical protein
MVNSMCVFLRRRLTVQASQGSSHPGRLVNPRLICFVLYFSHFSLIWYLFPHLYTHLDVVKGAHRLTSSC